MLLCYFGRTEQMKEGSPKALFYVCVKGHPDSKLSHNIIGAIQTEYLV